MPLTLSRGLRAKDSDYIVAEALVKEAPPGDGGREILAVEVRSGNGIVRSRQRASDGQAR